MKCQYWNLVVKDPNGTDANLSLASFAQLKPIEHEETGNTVGRGQVAEVGDQIVEATFAFDSFNIWQK